MRYMRGLRRCKTEEEGYVMSSIREEQNETQPCCLDIPVINSAMKSQ